MTIKKIEQDIITSMKARETIRVGVLRMLVNRIKMVAKNDGNRAVVDQDVLTGIQKSIKEVNETRDIYLSKGVDVSEQDAEIAILSVFLPKQMSQEDLWAAISEAANEAVERLAAEGKPNPGRALMGPIMNGLREKYAGQYDPKLASTLAATLVA